MTVEEALTILDAALYPKHLSNLQELIFCQCWDGRSYPEIAKNAKYDLDYIRDTGFKLWQLLSGALGGKVTKNNCRSVLRQYTQQTQGATALLEKMSTGVSSQQSIQNRKSKIQSREESSWAFSLTFSPDSTTLASSNGDLTVELWDVGTGRCLKTLLGHTSAITSVVFTPDGQTLASSSQDGTIKLWDVKTGKCLRTLRDMRTLRNRKSYEGMNIADVADLRKAQKKATLKVLKAADV